MQNKNIVLQVLNEELKKEYQNIRGTKLFGISHRTFFTPISEVCEKPESINMFSLYRIRFLGELLLQDPATYESEKMLHCRKTIEEIQKMKKVPKNAPHNYFLTRKKFQRLYVIDVLGKEIPCTVADVLKIDIKFFEHLQIADTSYRNIFLIQKDDDKENLALLYRKLHLYKFWSYTLMKKNN